MIQKQKDMEDSISEPRWATEEDSKRLRSLRKRVKNLYLNFSRA